MASGSAAAPVDYPAQRPVQFGTTTPAGVAMPQPTTYGRASATTAADQGGRRKPMALLSVVGAVAFVLGMLVGAAAVWILT